MADLLDRGALLTSKALDRIADALAEEWVRLLREDAEEHAEGSTVAPASARAGPVALEDVAEEADPEAGVGGSAGVSAALAEQRRLSLVSQMHERAALLLESRAAELHLSLPPSSRATHASARTTAASHGSRGSASAGPAGAMAEEAVRAFFDGTLHVAAQLILQRAAGSFGLTFSHSLDAGGAVAPRAADTHAAGRPAGGLTGGEVVVCAKGQTMSVAFYPQLGLVLFGSEAAATKAAMPLDPVHNPWWSPERKAELQAAAFERQRTGQRTEPPPAGEDAGPPFRYDLDDHLGEVVVLRWREQAPEPSQGAGSEGTLTSPLLASGAATAPREEARAEYAPGEELAFAYNSQGRRGELTIHSTPLGASKPVERASHLGCVSSAAKVLALRLRSVSLLDNPMVLPLPPTVEDPVGLDLRQLPPTLAALRDSFGELGPGSNTSGGRVPLTNQRVARGLAAALGQRLAARLGKGPGANTAGLPPASPDSADLLVIGCEVSLWVGEQFVSDLKTALPALRARAISSNKLLALFGQAVPIPQLGHAIDETLEIENTVVLLLSHSGGTFATLACAKMLRKHTPHVFAVSSEVDTHLGRLVNSGGSHEQRPATDRGGFPTAVPSVPRCFSTLTGFRVAEPCSISVAATHQLLTHVLLALMRALGAAQPELFPRARPVAAELARLSGAGHLAAIAEIVGDDQQTDSKTGARLRREGRRWAAHVLEGPWAWILSTIYIFATLLAGATPLSAVLAAAFAPAASGAAYVGARYAVAVLDSCIYAFLPWWTTVLLRLVQRRPWLHRVSGRSVLVADVPWVGQAAEAFLSKLFALSYSVAGLSVYSANPHDHLVHRHTHRVVRGSLLAVGRPDGRVHALAAAEATSLLSIKQASSIQSLGVTCETLTLGHNPWSLPRSIPLVLPTIRPQLLSEKLLQLHLAEATGSSDAGVEPSGRRDARPKAVRGAGAPDDSSVSSGSAPPKGGSARATHKSPNAIGGLYAHLASLPRLPPAMLRLLLGASQPHPSAGTREQTRAVVGAALSPLERGRHESRFDALEPATLLAEQRVLEVLYETRCASLQRLVGFFVLFHAMGKRVETFWSRVSFGLLAYDMSRTQSMMRVATTASPVSGMDV